MRLTDVDALIDDVKYRYCKDCNRRKGIKRGKYRVIYEVGDVPCRACGVGDMLDELDNAPTIDAEPVKHGHWIMKPNGYGTCSNCKVCSLDILGGVDSDYCPNCGAKMDEVEDGEIG